MSDDVRDLPTVTIGRKQWPVAEFVWRDTKVLMPKMQHIGNLNPNNITENDMNVMGDVAYLAISRVNGGLKREDFDALPITPKEILEAVPVILKQANMESKPAGEAQAQAAPTGTN